MIDLVPLWNLYGSFMWLPRESPAASTAVCCLGLSKDTINAGKLARLETNKCMPASFILQTNQYLTRIPRTRG